ncbi:MAG: hypothetical protein J0I98_06450 [Mesorhizobium sp.]|nr:hypothetical protein [Mesorhizobium sp.]MBN9242416.1 hypothetical protein [Mesorhizobium sp.]
MTKFIWHVALGAGDATAEPCGYTDAQLAAWRGHIDHAIDANAGAPIPGQPGYAVSARVIGRSLLCSVGRADDKTALVTFCVVEHQRQARKAWEALHEGYPQFAATLTAIPQVPYCAVRAEAGLVYDQAAAAWLDGYQLAVAWAWLTRRDTDA